MPSKLNLRSVALLLSPVLLLVAVALFLPARRKTPAASQLQLDSVEFRYTPSNKTTPKSQRVAMTVLVTYKGQEPAWWRKGARAQWLQNLKFVTASGKKYPWIAESMSPGPYEPTSQSHVIYCSGTLPPGYNPRQKASFEGSAIFANQLVPLKPLGIARFQIAI